MPAFQESSVFRVPWLQKPLLRGFLLKEEQSWVCWVVQGVSPLRLQQLLGFGLLQAPGCCVVPGLAPAGGLWLLCGKARPGLRPAGLAAKRPRRPTKRGPKWRTVHDEDLRGGAGYPQGVVRGPRSASKDLSEDSNSLGCLTEG